MATHVVSVFIDDFSGEELQPHDHRQIRFGVEGAEYTLDLSLAHADEFLTLLRPYTQAAEPVRKPPKQRQDRSARLQQVREWAKA
ncbi:MAG: Lsr2 family protein, partial [Actinobacteria bacterium]|nr:Lsr2 family protein [Actinomycetota bacterium]